MNTQQRVAFATSNGKTITKHFGHVKSFVVVEIADLQEQRRYVVTVDRSATHDRGEGRGHDHDAKLLPIEDCDTVVAGGMGTPMAARVLDAGFNLVLTSEPDIDKAIARFADGTLQHEQELAHAPRNQ
ncbi:MAG: NifB/NifX family molybdenum-iron cluster-binding protein [Acidimicrobiia bacterium]|nr:NifB/NifX family molybdenum-iron cluster-binding protein [Acidimicrobiia bacterium]